MDAAELFHQFGSIAADLVPEINAYNLLGIMGVCRGVGARGWSVCASVCVCEGWVKEGAKVRS